MRDSDTPATLNEIMGNKTNGQLTMADLKDVLGESMPTIELNKVGKFRLLQALRNRFGDNYRNIPGVKNILDDFDRELNIDLQIRKNKGAKNGQFS